VDVILRRCPICVQDSIVGHGRRRKQAHDEHHDWIGIRRGVCNRCGKTFTFLPLFSPPYGHYSLIARSQALRRRFVEGCGWEGAAPAVKDPDRMADPSTLRRWFSSLDSSLPTFSNLLRTSCQHLAPQQRDPRTRFLAVALAQHISISRPVLATADLETVPPTILAWECR
jgi:hypothetical protein